MEDTHIHWSFSGVLSIMNAQANLGNLIRPLGFIHSSIHQPVCIQDWLLLSLRRSHSPTRITRLSYSSLFQQFTIEFIYMKALYIVAPILLALSKFALQKRRISFSSSVSILFPITLVTNLYSLRSWPALSTVHAS